MAEKQAKKDEVFELKNFTEFISKHSADPPPIFLYCSQDSYEFDQIADHYRSVLSKKGEPFETVVFVSEPGGFDKFFSEIFNLSMFSSTKFILIKSGKEFFKSILTASQKNLFENFKRNISNLSDKIYILIHYEDKDVPSKLSSLFQRKYFILKNRNFYSNEKKGALESLLSLEKVSFDPHAQEEFLHRIIPNTGAYLKSIRKLKISLPKKHFTVEDIKEVLFDSATFNPFQIVDFLFSNMKSDFFREFSRLKSESEDGTTQILSFLSILLTRVDELRKAKILFKRFNDDESEKEVFKALGMDFYSEGRKKFVKSRLKKEIRIFSDRAISHIYETILEANIRQKTSPNKTLNKFRLQSRFENLFEIISAS